MNEVRARTLKGFCIAYGVSRSRAYLLLASGKIRGVCLDGRTLILEDSALEWLAGLPTYVPNYLPNQDAGGQNRTGRDAIGRRKPRGSVVSMDNPGQSETA